MAKEPKQETAPAIVPRKELILEGDPETQLEFAKKAATALMKVVESKPKKVIINGKQYLEYGSWQTLARFFGATAGVEWTKPILNQKGLVVGYEARAEVLQRGERISSAEASCLRTERNWASRDEFALKSMAQTRAAAKALRNAFGWVAELAGYQSAPAEEMDAVHGGVIKLDDVPEEAEITVSGADAEPKKEPRKLTETDKKKLEIKTLIDTKILTPLEQTAEAYAEYVKANTGLA